MQVTHYLFQKMRSTETLDYPVKPTGRLWGARLCRHDQVVLTLGSARGAIRLHKLFRTSRTSCNTRLPAMVTLKMRFLLPPLSEVASPIWEVTSPLFSRRWSAACTAPVVTVLPVCCSSSSAITTLYASGVNTATASNTSSSNSPKSLLLMKMKCVFFIQLRYYFHFGITNS